MFLKIKSLRMQIVPAAIACSLCMVDVSAQSVAPTVAAPAASTPVATPSTIWRFLGIPQGIQKVRDVTVNRRGNHPRLERKPPIKRIADLANLESPNPAIKAAAEIKQAEDMKAQKIKAIKYLATIGCGCYDKDGKITDALLAATDDCTPDVRMAAIEAIKDAASGECCRQCGSTSCCNEKVSKRLSEIAYERDDSGCPLESSAEIREMAKKTLCICCPGGPPTGPIEEDYPEEEALDGGGPGQVPTPAAEEPKIRGESTDADQGVRGESSIEENGIAPSNEGEVNGDTDLDVEENLENETGEDLVLSHALSALLEVKVGEKRTVGSMTVQPVTLVLASESESVLEKPSSGRSVMAVPVSVRLTDECMDFDEDLKLSDSATDLP